MTTNWCLGIAMGGAIALGANYASAQIITDGTLPNNSIVTSDGSTLNITGGTQAGSNLFHSFREFSVPTNGAVLFNNAVDIQNIISRVTGGSVSNIDGLIRANGTANLFLINPSGIIFGQNARLDIGGSFVGTTANALQFGNIGFFSATDQNIPSPLLTINPSALLFNQINQNGGIQNNSIAPTGTDPAGFDAFGLRVPDGKSLLLVGGNLSMDGGQLNAFGGRVELGGLAGEGMVELNGNSNGNLLNLNFPTVVPRADVSLSNNFLVDVRGFGGGSIIINAQNIDVRESSSFIAGIASGLRTASSRAGDITLNATGAIVIDNSLIGSDIREGSVGNGSNINIQAQSVTLNNGAALIASTRGRGNGGRILIQATDRVSFDGTTSDSRFGSGAFSEVGFTGMGNAGDVNITTSSLSVTNGAQLVASTRGQGNAGNININTREQVSFNGTSSDGAFSSGAFSDVEVQAVGRGGNININTSLLSVTNGAQLVASTRGRGDAGNININTREQVSFNGTSSDGAFSSGAFSDVEVQAVGSGGNVNINTSSLSVTNRAEINVSIVGTGNAGDLQVATRFIKLDNQGKLLADSVVGVVEEILIYQYGIYCSCGVKVKYLLSQALNRLVETAAISRLIYQMALSSPLPMKIAISLLTPSLVREVELRLEPLGFLVW
ncbi:two-partner secretion domain-containing protein [Nostoc sp. DSM 114160]